jgi:small multidrug resistance pump
MEKSIISAPENGFTIFFHLIKINSLWLNALQKMNFIYWVILGLGIIFEVLGTICMKYADGFQKLWPSVFVFFFYILCLICLVFVLQKLNVSVAYAIWASLGTALIAVIGMIWFKEPVSVIKIISLGLIIIGIIGLELSE